MHRVMQLVFWASAILSVAAATAAPVWAQESDEERARRHFNAGESYYDQARYEDAAREFQRAYDLSERTHLLKNVAVSHERAGHLGEAVKALKLYLETESGAEDRKTIEERISQLESRIEEEGETAAAEASGGDPTQEAVEESTLQDAGQGRRMESDGGTDTLAWVLIGGGGVLAVASVITGVLAHSDFSDLEEACDNDICPKAEEDTRDRGETLALVSTLTTVGAVAAVGAGVLLLLLGGDETPTSASVELGFAPKPGGAALAVGGKF